jgi:hypothetical protein
VHGRFFEVESSRPETLEEKQGHGPTSKPPYAERRKVTSRDLRVMSLATVTF